MVTPVSTFDELLSRLSLLKGVEKFKQFQGKNKTIVLGAAGHMGEGIVNSTSRAGSGAIRQDLDIETLESSRNNIVRTQSKAVKVHKLAEKQQKLVNRGGLIGPAIVFNKREPFADIAKAHKEDREAAEEIVLGFLDSTISNERTRKDYGNATLLIEVGPELLAFKQNAFEFFDLALKKGSVLASNTSILDLNKIAERVDSPENVVGFHFFSPADRNPLVEIIPTEKTSPEVIEGMRQLAYAMNKQPIVVKESVANVILIGIVNHLAKIADEGVYSPEFLDKVFLETFYGKQIGVKTKKAQAQFEEAPKLGLFKDEVKTYKKIEEIDAQIQAASSQGWKGERLLDKLFTDKLTLLKDASGNLNQKKLYTSIVDLTSRFGDFFKSAALVGQIKDKAGAQLKVVNEYLGKVKVNRANLIHPFKVEPYTLVIEKENYSGVKDERAKEVVSDRLKAAYIGIASKLVGDGLASIHDIELACKQGFKWNVGPFELVNQMGVEKANELVVRYCTTDTYNIDNHNPGNIAQGVLPTKEITNEDLSGVKSYIQDGIGFVELGRLHIQNLQQFQNSLNPEMLNSIITSMTELQDKGAKAIVFKSQGGGAFSSGADLNYAQSVKDDPEKLKEFVRLGKKAMNYIQNFDLPTLALVDGPAVGGGAELAASCDYRIMVDEESFIAFPEVGLGLIPEWTGTEILPRIVGKELAKAMICNVRNPLTAPKLTAKDAKEVGFANAVVSRTELYSFLAEVIKGNVPEIDLTKKPEKKQNFDKSNYSDNIKKKFSLVNGFQHIGYLPTTKKSMAKEAARFIDNSHDPEYEKKHSEEWYMEKVRASFTRINKWQIQPLVWLAQSKRFAPLLEKFGIL